MAPGEALFWVKCVQLMGEFVSKGDEVRSSSGQHVDRLNLQDIGVGKEAESVEFIEIQEFGGGGGGGLRGEFC